MSALVLFPESDLSVTSATNLQSYSSKDYLLDDRLGLETCFSNSTTIILDRGATAPSTWDTIALVNNNLPNSATIQVDVSTASNFTPLTTFNPSDGLDNAVGSRGKIALLTIPSVRSERYVRLIITTTGAFDLGRIIIGKSIAFSGVSVNAERIIEDTSDILQVGAWQSVIQSPVLPGWKVEVPLIKEVDFRASWAPFLIRAGQRAPFLFVPRIEDTTQLQADWCYGRITSTAKAQNPGFDAWTVQFQMRGIYP